MDKRIITGDVKDAEDQVILRYLTTAEYQEFADWLQSINKRTDIIHIADMAQQYNASWLRWSDVQRRLSAIQG